MPAEPLPGKTSQGQHTRGQILTLAGDIASAEGLAALTIGRLATQLNMSKSGLFAHFGSKTGLQLATVDRAREDFARRVLAPHLRSAPGLIRLWRVFGAWIDTMENPTFSGGCLLLQAAAEFDGQPGPVRDKLADSGRDWIGWMAQELTTAVEEGDLDAETDPHQLAFEIHALGQQANWTWQLLEDGDAFARAHNGFAARVEALATQKGKRALRLQG